MKLTGVLFFVQLAVLIGLLFKVTALENAVNAEREQDIRTSVVASNSPDVPSFDEIRTQNAAITEQQLRQIVQEELAAYLQNGLAMNSTPSDQTPPDLSHDVDYQLRRQMVAQSLDYFVEVGEISDAEMANLQLQMARLNAEDRRALLGRLGQLLSAGKVDGKL